VSLAVAQERAARRTAHCFRTTSDGSLDLSSVDRFESADRDPHGHVTDSGPSLAPSIRAGLQTGRRGLPQCSGSRHARKTAGQVLPASCAH